MAIEGHCSKRYFKQIFQLFPSFIRTENRKTFKAYDGLNNLFNLAYTVLKWKVYRAIIRAKLEPYLGLKLQQIRHGKRQTIETLINEEAFLLAKYLRGEHETWSPRIVLPFGTS